MSKHTRTRFRNVLWTAFIISLIVSVIVGKITYDSNQHDIDYSIEQYNNTHAFKDRIIEVPIAEPDFDAAVSWFGITFFLIVFSGIAWMIYERIAYKIHSREKPKEIVENKVS